MHLQKQYLLNRQIQIVRQKSKFKRQANVNCRTNRISKVWQESELKHSLKKSTLKTQSNLDNASRIVLVFSDLLKSGSRL